MASPEAGASHTTLQPPPPLVEDEQHQQAPTTTSDQQDNDQTSPAATPEQGTLNRGGSPSTTRLRTRSGGRLTTTRRGNNEPIFNDDGIVNHSRKAQRKNGDKNTSLSVDDVLDDEKKNKCTCKHTYALAVYLGLHLLGLALMGASVGTSIYFYQGDYQEINRSTGQSQTLNDAEVTYSLWQICVKQLLGGGSGLSSNAVCLSRVDGSSNERITGHMQAARVLVTIPLGSIALGIGFSLLHFLGATRRVSFLILPAIVSAIVPLAAGAVILRLYTTTEGEGGPVNLPSGVTAAPISAPVDRHGTSVGASSILAIVTGLIMMWTILVAVAVKLAYPSNPDKIKRPALRGTRGGDSPANDPFEPEAEFQPLGRMNSFERAALEGEENTNSPFASNNNSPSPEAVNLRTTGSAGRLSKEPSESGGGFAAWGEEGVPGLAINSTPLIHVETMRRRASSSAGSALSRRSSVAANALNTATTLEERRTISRRLSQQRKLQEELNRSSEAREQTNLRRSSRRSSMASRRSSFQHETQEHKDGFWHGLRHSTDGSSSSGTDLFGSLTNSGGGQQHRRGSRSQNPYGSGTNNPLVLDDVEMDTTLSGEDTATLIANAPIASPWAGPKGSRDSDDNGGKGEENGEEEEEEGIETDLDGMIVDDLLEAPSAPKKHSRRSSYISSDEEDTIMGGDNGSARNALSPTLLPPRGETAAYISEDGGSSSGQQVPNVLSPNDLSTTKPLSPDAEASHHSSQ